MLMAGLYDEAIDKSQSQPTYTFAIVTTNASKPLSWLHDRQPVVLSSEDEINRWLDTSSQSWSSDLSRLLHPWKDSEVPLQCYQVAKEVGKVGTESAKFIEPISNRKDGIMAMFAKQRSKQAKSSVKRKRSASPTPSLSTPKKVKESKMEEDEEKR